MFWADIGLVHPQLKVSKLRTLKPTRFRTSIKVSKRYVKRKQNSCHKFLFVWKKLYYIKLKLHNKDEFYYCEENKRFPAEGSHMKTSL